MKHQKVGRQFSRNAKQRKALLRGLLSNLVLSERMTTTEAKAKETKSLIDPVVNVAKRIRVGGTGRLALIRRLHVLVSAPAAKKLLSDFGGRFEERKSGYSRVMKLESRLGDGAQMAVIELILSDVGEAKKK